MICNNNSMSFYATCVQFCLNIILLATHSPFLYSFPKHSVRMSGWCWGWDASQFIQNWLKVVPKKCLSDNNMGPPTFDIADR